jgi:anti-sigma regulatory factor (Ser/Thr protein kinase)
LLAVIISPTYDGKSYASANKLRRNALLPKLSRTALVSTNGNGKDIDTENLKKILLADVLRLATREKLRIVTDKRQLPPQLEHKSEPIPLGVGENVRQLRWNVRSVCAEAGLLTEYSDSLEMAAGEAANNSLVHATGGIGLVSWNNNGKVQVKIEDTGTGIPFEDLPRATLERGYTTAGTLGQGFWIILQSVKRCWIATSESGTTVIIEQDNEDTALEDLPVPVLF